MFKKLMLLLLLSLCLSFPIEGKAAPHTVPSNMAERMYGVMAGDPANRLELDKNRLSSYSLGSGTHLQNGSAGPVLWTEISSSSGSKSNVATLRFSNTGAIFGRQTDVTMTVESTTWGNHYCSDCSSGELTKAPVLWLSDDFIEIGVIRTNMESWLGIDVCNHRQYTHTISYLITWHDNGQPISSSIPLYQTILDMDSVNKSSSGTVRTREGVTCTTGYTGDLFIFPQIIADYSASSGNVVMNASNDTVGMEVEGSYGAAIADGSDSIVHGGGIATAYGPTIRQVWREGNCGTKLKLYSPAISLKAPVKSVNNSHGYYDGDTCDWTITQELNTKYADIYLPYNSFVFTDTLDANLEIIGVDVYKDNTSNKLGTGNYTYSKSGQIVTVTMAQSYLNNMDIYNGGKLIFVIHTKVKANGLTKATIPNTGRVSICGTACNTNTVSIRPWYRVYVTHEGQGTTNPAEKKEQIEWDANTKVTYIPAKNWYTKEVYYGSRKSYTDSGKSGLTHKGGSGLKANSLLTEYTFTGIRENKHLHAVFIPIPELTVQKAIEGTKNYSPFGTPLFYYKITGTDYLGDKHTWYWNAQGENTITRKVPAGDYTVMELPVDRWELVKAENVKNFSNVSVSSLGGTCNLKNGLPTDTPGSSAGDGHIKFTNKLADWEDFGHNSGTENRMK